ncbi:hypothetical protein [Actinokineospora sp.]|uniref:hypothetical protein n=1 Tax=Actinokineospora sp. TaxID=1872133 RepID=UPI0040376E79
MTAPGHALVADPAWRAQARAEGLVVFAGADLVFLVPDVSRADAEEVAALFDGREVDPGTLEPSARALLPQLQSLGALRPAALPRPGVPRALRIGTLVVGETSVALAAELAAAFAPTSAQVGVPEVLLVVRTTGRLSELIALSAALVHSGRIHLLLDLAYHHTATLGPLVVPGATACLECLARRAGQRWGDPEPPGAPGAAVDPRLPIALAAHAVRELGTGSLALLQRTVAHDLRSLTATAEDVLPSADCATCARPAPGRITLPWETEAMP